MMTSEAAGLTLVRSFGLKTSAPIVGVRSTGRATMIQSVMHNETYATQ